MLCNLLRLVWLRPQGYVKNLGSGGFPAGYSMILPYNLPAGYEGDVRSPYHCLLGFFNDVLGR